jgi:hypothetical protein
MTHVTSICIFPAVVTRRTHIGGRPADVTADLLRRLRRCSVGDNGNENPMSHFWGDGTTVTGRVGSVVSSSLVSCRVVHSPP